MAARLPEALHKLARLLPAPLFVVGGYVRNLLMWGEPRSTDVDVCGAMTVDQVAAALEGTGATVIPVNPRVGTVLIRYLGWDCEYTTFRRDSYPIGGVHTPDSVTFVQSVEEDALRRDFRVNALYMDVSTEQVSDPTGGMKDLADRVISTTRTPAEVFAEDGLRILRMVRFCAELGFSPAEDALRVAKEMRAQLADISPERKREELDKILLADRKYGVTDGPQKGLELLNQLDLWPYLYMQGAHDLRPAFASPKLETRLAALCYAAVGDFAFAFASIVLGKEGLRYSNRQVAEVKRLLAGMDLPLPADERYLWASQYADVSLEIFALWQDPEKEAAALRAIVAVERADVPRSHKDLPLTPAEIEALGVPKAELSHVMRAVVDWCVMHLTRLTRAQCERLILEKRWKEEI